MDNFPEDINQTDLTTLSYDDVMSYEEQLPPPRAGGMSLADRISHSKVYLLSESTVTRGGKVRSENAFGDAR